MVAERGCTVSKKGKVIVMKKWFGIAMLLLLSLQSVYADPVRRVPQPPTQFNELTPRRKQSTQNSVSHINQISSCNVERSLNVGRLPKVSSELSWCCSRKTTKSNNSVDKELDCEIKCTDVDQLAQFLKGKGCVIRSKSERFGMIHAYVLASRMNEIVSDARVIWVREVVPPIHNKTNTSAGDVAHKAATARSQLGVSGAGVKIGVISDSARYLTDMQSSGDLPSYVTVLPGLSGAIEIGGVRYDAGEGTAMMEIVHDLCPGASLYFATSGDTEAEMAESVLALRNAGCDIIVDDICFVPESAFQDGIVAQAVNEVTADGCIYVTCAANKGNVETGHGAVWEGDFKSCGTVTLGGIEYEVHGFGSLGNNQYSTLWYWAVGSDTSYGTQITLQWSDANGRSANDYALALYDTETSRFIQLSDSYQSGAGYDPFEYMEIGRLGDGSYWTSGTYSGLSLVILREKGAANRYLRLSVFDGASETLGDVLEFVTPGQVYGHNAAEHAICVAAAVPVSGRAFTASDSPAYYTSDGPRRMFYNASGAAYTTSLLSDGGKLLNKPDVMGASSVSCATPGFNPFSGTSAAAPHVAAIVGLMLEANGRLGLEEVRAILHESTVSSSGWNKTKGYGAVDAYVAVQAAKNAEPKLDFGSSSKTVSAEGGSVSVAVSANVSWTVSKSAGAAWLNLSNTSGAGDGSINFTADRNNTTSARNATLTLTGEGLTRTCSVLQEGMTAPVRPVVTASDGSSSDSITVKWENCARALTYSLRRAESATGNKTLLDANATSPYVDVNVTPGKTYYYWVTAVNEIGSNESSYDSGYRSINLSLDAGGNVYTKSGGESSFSVSGNSSWTVTCSDEWITLGTTTGSGSGVVRFTVDKNFDGETRYGTIVVTSGSVSRTITVTQPGRVLVVANSGSITINTGASSPSFYVSSSGKTHYGSVVDGTAVYKFDYLEIGSSVSVSVSGSRPLVIESETDMKVACGFDVSGTSSGRCGGGIGGAGGSGGTTVTGGGGGSGGSRGSGGNGYTVSNYSGTTQGQSGKSGSVGDTGYNGSSGNYGTSGSSGGKGFGSTGSAASGGSRGSGGSAGSAASSVGSLGTGGYAGADGNPGGSGTKGNAGGAGNDGSSGSNGVNAFTSALTSDVIMAGAGGGGGGGGGSGGSGGGGSGGGGGGGGGGTSQTEAKSYSGNTTYINRGVYQGAIGGFGGTGGNGGKGATSGAGGSGGTGGHGGGAIVLKAAGVMKFTGSVDVSAANGSRSGSSGSSASSASSGVSGGFGTAGQGALNLQTFSSLYPSSGHKGGDGGTGGAGGNAGKGGAGGAGGYGAPGMVKLYASVLLASDGRVSGANGDNSTTASRCGGLTLATNMKSAALTAQKPTVATTIKCGERSGSPSLKITSVYDEEVTVPVVGQLKVSHADASGVCESGNYALSLVSSQSAEGSVDGLTIKRLTTLFEGYDQIFLINDSSAKIGPVEVEINGVACSIPELAVGEAWTTCVQAGVAVAGGEIPPAEPTSVTASDGTYSDKVLVSWTGSSGATTYNLYRSTSSTRPSAATKTGVTSPYSDTSATPGTTYYYWVSAVNSAGSSFSSYNTGYRAVSVSIGATTASFDAAGGTGSTTVTANTSWSATADVSWITFTTASGSGNGSVAYTVAASTSTEPRTGTITITVGAGTSHSVTKTITVSQGVAEDDGKMPDLTFAQFSGWNHNFAIFTVAQGGDSTNTPLRVFDKGEGFSLVYGYANFGEGVATGTMTNRIELFDVDDELVYENDGDETIDFEQYWGRSQVFTAYAWEDLEPGAYIAQVSLDAYDQIVEEDEDNNVGTFRFAVRDPVSLNEALDNTALTFTTDVAKGWFGTKGLGADGVDAAQCTHIGHSSTNSMSTTVTGPGTISFKWKVSSENGWDELCFLVDGARRVSMSGTGGDWDERSYELPSGAHTLTWSYCKDDSYSDGVDCGWVDQVAWTPAQSAPPAPSSVSATDGTYADKVSISWTGSSGATSYNLYRSTTSTRPSTATMTGVTSPYSDTTATPGTKYYYWVSAVNSAGSSFSASDTGYRAVSLSLGKATDLYVAAGGNGSASVAANTSWSTTKNVSWITLGTSSGSGNGTLTYTVAANSSADSRTGTITVTAGSGTSYPVAKSITVTQEGASDFVIVDGVLTKYTGAGGAVTIPSVVASIGSHAFDGCTGLISVVIPSGVMNIGEGAFICCKGLESVVLSEGLTSIDDNAFCACASLKSVVIPESVTNIGEYAFSMCDNLASVTIRGSLDAIRSGAFCQCPSLEDFEVPVGVKTIEDYAFGRCTGLECVDLPDSLKCIGESAFYSCEGLLSINIPNGVTNIDNLAFAWCTSLTKCDLPLSVTRIGNEAFGDSGIVVFSIHERVESIGSLAFSGCDELVSVDVHHENKNYSSCDGMLLNKDKTELICCPAGKTGEIVVPSGVTNVLSHAFSRTGFAIGGATSVIFSSGVTAIGPYAFFQCGNLQSVYLPSSVALICTDAFSCCGKLSTVYVDDGDESRVRKLLTDSGLDCSGVVFLPIATEESLTWFSTKDEAFAAAREGGKRVLLLYGRESCAKCVSTRTVTCENVAVKEKLLANYVLWYSNCDTQSAESRDYLVNYDGDLPGVTVIDVELDRGIVGTSGGLDVAGILALLESAESYEPPTPKVATPIIVSADGSTFDTDSCIVTITCATEGVTIYYSTNGSTPRQKDQFKYTQPFTITGTTTIKAVAVKDGFTQSEIATATITKVDPPPLTLASALDEPKLSAVETDGDAEWEPVKDVTAVGGSSARSGVVGMLQRTCLKTTVYGKGSLSFKWKVSCEADYSGEYTYDHMTFSTVEGGRTNDIAKIDGETEWLSESVNFTTDGPHVILWTYSTDDWEEPGFEDCGWVDHVVWTGDAPPSDIVISDVVTLPKAEVESFMAKYPSLAAQVGGDAEAFAKLPSATGKLDENGNQMYVWQDIIAGTDPTNPDDKFKIVDIKFEDGKLKITWSPDLNEGGKKNVRAYTEFGRKELGTSEEWTNMKDVNPAEKNDYKFRKVTVDMP